MWIIQFEARMKYIDEANGEKRKVVIYIVVALSILSLYRRE